MKLIGKLILTLLLLVLLVVIVLYVLAQTQWGAKQITQWVNQRAEYQVSFKKMVHDWSSPGQITLQDISFSHKNQPVTLVAKNIVVGFSVRQITDPRHFSSLILEGGTLNLAQTGFTLPIEADRLQLKNMALQGQDGDWRLQGEQVTGGITPWQPEQGALLGKKAAFQLSAQSLTLNDLPASKVLVQGQFNGQQLMLENFGADVARGELTGNASRAADGSWLVNTLRLSNVRLQTQQSITDFWQPVTHLPAVTINRFDLIDARIEGLNWALTDLDVTLQNVTFRQNDWQSDDGSLSFNATDIVNGNMHFVDPIVSLDLSKQGVNVKQFSTRWEGGLLRTSGNWLRSNHRLTLDELVVAGMEYTLPGDWRQRWMQTLPDWLTEVEIKKFSANHNLLIDITPEFPFQLTALDGSGNNLLLARNHQWGIWQGSLTLNASDATFNKVDVRRPSVALSANDNQITLTDLSAFTKSGLLEAKAVISQQPSRLFTLDLNGKAVAFDVLTRWGWPQPATAPAGNTNLQLHLNGRLDATSPLKPTLGGTLQGIDSNGRTFNQNMHQGSVNDTAPTAVTPTAAPEAASPVPLPEPAAATLPSTL
ncbi:MULTISPECIES: AsmA family protein [Dickeya]|uniref:FIG01200701: possible membrane protein. AsmA family n=1 Tax=Dickeya aquatica TaxID=1401087 RepID=A0A375A583_9GAMM|nr:MULTISPECIES: AsmA family protein [Dickeya]SLM61180.1 FIG01200701: possible membrane protein. AsmA family [Dickeya aquatica]